MIDSINWIMISVLVMVVLVTGFVFNPLFTGLSSFTAEAAPCVHKKVTLIAGETTLYISRIPLRQYNAMTWNGTIPGPVISVDQCDILDITLKNVGAVPHSLDFHAGNGPSNAVGCGTLRPGETMTCTLHADYPGFFMYHCAGDAINGVWEHIANGMYGGIVVHPRAEVKAKEFYVSFGEIYSNTKNPASFDINRFKADNPEFVLTNGASFLYVPSIGKYAIMNLNPGAAIFKAKPNELTRWYILNPGPNDDVAFHFISGMISVHDGMGPGGVSGGQLGTQITYDETWNIPAGSGSVIETIFPEKGIYVGVDHSMKDVLKGGAFLVQATDSSTPDDHPIGTSVPPKGSPIAVGDPFTEPPFPIP